MVALLLVGFALALLVLLYRELYSWPDNFPPGPCRLPVYGSYWWLLLKDYHRLPLAVDKLCAEYKGGMMGLFLGSKPAVCVTDPALMWQVLSRPELQGRHDNVVSRARNFNRRLGILLLDGPEWREQRRFTLRHMRDFGFSRRFASAEEDAAAEVQELLDLMAGRRHDQDVRRSSDGALQFPGAIYRCFPALLWAIFAGARPGRDNDKQLLEIGRGARQAALAGDATGNAVSISPWLRFIGSSGFGLWDFAAGAKPMFVYIQKAIEEHMATYSEDDIRDFIDVYIREMKKRESEEDTTYEFEQLMIIGLDLLFASAVVSSSVLGNAVHLLVLHPEVQHKIQQEIDDVVGRRRFPAVDDRKHMPYLEATIRETMRRRTPNPLNVGHEALETTTLAGYTIPKGTLLMACMQFYHMNPEVWGDPENFRPDRFIDPQGKLLPDLTIPFGGGRRLCISETFSRNILFLFLAGILQSFTLRAPKGEVSPPFDEACKYGFVVMPDDMWVLPEPRA